MSFVESQHPRTAVGSPTAGQFAAKPAGAEAGISLAPTRARTPEAVAQARAAVDALMVEACDMSFDERWRIASTNASSVPAGARLRVEAKRALRLAARQAGWSEDDILPLGVDWQVSALEHGNMWDRGILRPGSTMPTKFIHAAANALVATAGAELIGVGDFTEEHHRTLMEGWTINGTRVTPRAPEAA